MNGYIAFWNGQRTEVRASTSYAAQQLAERVFQAGTRKRVKGHDITVMLAEMPDGTAVVHTPTI